MAQDCSELGLLGLFGANSTDAPGKEAICAMQELSRQRSLLAKSPSQELSCASQPQSCPGDQAGHLWVPDPHDGIGGLAGSAQRPAAMRCRRAPGRSQIGAGY